MLFQTVTSSPEVGDLWLILRHRVSRSSWRELKAACVKIRVHFVNMNLLEEVFFFLITWKEIGEDEREMNVKWK